MTTKRPAMKVATKVSKKAMANPETEQVYKAKKVKRVIGPYPNVPSDPIEKIKPGQVVEVEKPVFECDCVNQVFVSIAIGIAIGLVLGMGI